VQYDGLDGLWLPDLGIQLLATELNNFSFISHPVSDILWEQQKMDKGTFSLQNDHFSAHHLPS
jgi:hypothetical protein